uniref:interleukin-21 receptor n=1 Tax=Euleptes europaea TaxID=460621 RepID=UPI0025423CFA|nr:interleukin-21 receptor [Euleptes europaea]
MRPPALLFLLLLQHSKSDSACKNLKCFADYIQTLTCIWGTGMPRGKLHNLTATWGCGRGGTCDFLPTVKNASPTRYACSSEQKLCKTFAVMVTLVDGTLAVCQTCGPFQYHENVKPRPPFNVTAAACPGGYNISWESGYAADHYLHGELQYQLHYRQKGHPWSLQGGTAGGLKSVLQDTPSLWLLPQELAGGVEYELQVRTGPRDHSLYRGTWSDWSPSSSLQTLPAGTAGAVWLVTPLLALSLMVTLLAFLGRHWSSRWWKKLEQFIPSPAPFFQTLYLVHNGDFKKWAGTSCSGATLDVHECGTAQPEVFKISLKPLLTTAARGETSALPCGATLPAAVPGEEPASALEQAYGHLSIDTVTVADVCGLEPEAYRHLPLDSGHTGSLAPYSEMPPPLPPWLRDLCPEQLSALYGAPVGASSPPPAKPFRREPCSPTWGPDGDTALDLDTVDSGFADSDCGSPTDCDCQGRRAGCTTPAEEDGAAFLPSYVKQWVTCYTPPEERS